MIGWSLASPFDAKNHKPGHLRVEAAWEGKSRFKRPIIKWVAVTLCSNTNQSIDELDEGRHSLNKQGVTVSLFF